MRQARPSLLAQGQGGHDGIDANEVHAAQNEGHDGARQIEALCQTTSGYRTAITGLRQGIGQGVGAHGVHHACPAFFLQGFASGRQLGAVHQTVRTQAFQIGFFAGFAGGGHHLIAQFGQQGDGHAANAASGSGHQNFTAAGLDALLL